MDIQFCCDELEWTINAVINIYEKQSKLGLEHLLIAWLIQDVIESTFYVFRQRSNYDRYKAIQILLNYLSNMKLIKSSILSNCEVDDNFIVIYRFKVQTQL